MNPLGRQVPVRSPLSLRAVAAALGSGDPRPALTAEIGRLWEFPTVRLTDSGTSALALALRLARSRRPAGIALLPGFGCFDLATAALGAGVPVALYDIDPRTLAPVWDSLAPLIDATCAAVVVVDHYGIPPDIGDLLARARSAGAMVIEDVAQGAGAHWDQHRAGHRADAAVLSFGRGKGVTGGGGGALLLSAEWTVPDDADTLAPRSGALGTVAATIKLAAQYALARPSLYGIPARLPFLQLGETVYRAPTPPGPMLPSAARVLRHTLPTMDAEASTRRRHAERLRATQHSRARGSAIDVDPRAVPGWLRLPMLVDPARRIDPAQAAQLGIVPSYPSPLAELPALRDALVGASRTEGAALLCRRLWTLPTHGALRERDLRALERWIEDTAA